MKSFQTSGLRINMEGETKGQLLKGCIAYATLFSLSFILHIIFAVKSFDIAFQIIAALITFLFSDFVDIRNKDNTATEYGAMFPSG